jgi:hypothetical protein
LRGFVGDAVRDSVSFAGSVFCGQHFPAPPTAPRAPRPHNAQPDRAPEYLAPGHWRPLPVRRVRWTQVSDSVSWAIFPIILENSPPSSKTCSICTPPCPITRRRAISIPCPAKTKPRDTSRAIPVAGKNPHTHPNEPFGCVFPGQKPTKQTHPSGLSCTKHSSGPTQASRSPRCVP